MGEQRERSFAAELLNRRVPQILGLFVAATWMGVEIGEWLSERFALPASLSSYVFIGMLSLAPTVALLAWSHGAPGRDRWTRFQVLFVSLNVLAAAAAVALLVRPPEVIAATETRSLTDETGTVVTYEVAREGFHRRLLAFFWRNESGDPELDWLGYGAPWLLVQDIGRSPLVRATTPFDSALVIDRFRATGFERGIGEPLSLDLDIARERGLGHIVTGQIDATANGPILTARVYEVASGELVGEWGAAGPDWLAAIDRLSADIAAALLPTVETRPALPRLSLAEHASTSLPAIRALIEALARQAFDNDYAGALEAVQTAIELDPRFAEAFVHGMHLSRLTGDTTTALAFAERALALDYKLYSERKLEVKAMSYALQLQNDKATRVLEMWTQVHPDSPRAFALLAQNYITIDGRLQEARRALETVLELDPTDQRQLLSLAAVLRLEGRVEEAVGLIQSYLASHAEDVEAYRSLAAAHVQAGALGAARSAHEQAAFLDTGNPIAELDLALLAIREGDLEQAHEIVRNLLNRELTDRQRFAVLGAARRAYLEAGRITEALDVLAEQAPLASRFLPPLVQVFEIGMWRASCHALLGHREQALRAADEVRAGLHPPMDTWALFAHLAVYQELDDQPAFGETLAALERFAERFQVPFIEPFILEGRARLKRWAGDPDGALGDYERMIERASLSALSLQEPALVELILLQKAETLREAGRPDEAVAVIEALVKTNPGMTAAHLTLAEAHADLDRIVEARTALDVVRARWSRADPQYLRLERVARLDARLDAAG